MKKYNIVLKILVLANFLGSSPMSGNIDIRAVTLFPANVCMNELPPCITMLLFVNKERKRLSEIPCSLGSFVCELNTS